MLETLTDSHEIVTIFTSHLLDEVDCLFSTYFVYVTQFPKCLRKALTYMGHFVFKVPTCEKVPVLHLMHTSLTSQPLISSAYIYNTGSSYIKYLYFKYGNIYFNMTGIKPFLHSLYRINCLNY